MVQAPSSPVVWMVGLTRDPQAITDLNLPPNVNISANLSTSEDSRRFRASCGVQTELLSVSLRSAGELLYSNNIHVIFMMRLPWNTDLSKDAEGPVSDSVGPEPIERTYMYAKLCCDNLSFDVIRDLYNDNAPRLGSGRQAQKAVFSLLTLM